MKYLVTVIDGAESIFVFPRSVDHDRMAEALSAIRFGSERDWSRKLRESEVIAAGFVSAGQCGGKSETLKLKSRGAVDTALLRAVGGASVASQDDAPAPEQMPAAEPIRSVTKTAVSVSSDASKAGVDFIDSRSAYLAGHRDARHSAAEIVIQSAKDRGDVVVTRTPAGEIIAVTRQDAEGRILTVIAEAPAPSDDKPICEFVKGDPDIMGVATRRERFDLLPDGRTPVYMRPPAASFQSRVKPWLHDCFGEFDATDPVQRNHRALEEMLELVQACGCTQDEALQLVAYVYNRPAGEKRQEVGGVMVTLAALCLAQGIDMNACGEDELTRVWSKIGAIRAKQAAKAKDSPLPGQSPASHGTDSKGAAS